MHLVARDRTAEGEADLVALEFVVVLFEGTGLAQVRTAIEAEDRTVDLVATRLGGDAQGAALRSADLGVEARRHHPKLPDGVHRKARPREPEGLVGELDTVDHEGGLARVGAGADHHRVLDESVAAALAVGAGRDISQPLELARRHRQVLDLLGGDVGRRVGLEDVDHGCLAGHRDGFRHLHLHGEDQSRGLADADGDVSVGRRKARERHTDVILAGRQRRDDDETGHIGDRGAGRAGRGVDHPPGHTRHGQRLLVHCVDLDRPGRDLCRHRQGEPQQQHGQAGRRKHPEPSAFSHVFLPFHCSVSASTAT